MSRNATGLGSTAAQAALDHGYWTCGRQHALLALQVSAILDQARRSALI